MFSSCNRRDLKKLQGENGQMYRSKHNQDIVGLILRLKTFEDEYPYGMFSYRRSSFLMLIARYLGVVLYR